MADLTEKENLTELIESSMDKRNRNWNKVDSNTSRVEELGELIAYSGLKTVNPSVITGGIVYYKRFGEVTISIEHSTIVTELVSFGNLDLFTLPVGFRPATELWFPLAIDNSASAMVLRIYPNGLVRLHSRSGSVFTTSFAFRGSASYTATQ